MTRSLLLVMALGACTGTSTPTPEPQPEPAPEMAPAPVPTWEILAPSPLELEAEVAKAGVTGLDKLVPATMPAISTTNKDQAALQTGIVAAYTVLAGRTLPKDKLIAQIKAMRAGLATVGTGEGTLKAVDRFVEQIENDTAARDDFLKELDAEVQMTAPEEGWGPDDTTGPLLQAGAWLAGIHLVSKRIVEMNDATAADKLLQRDDVAAFFLKYIQTDEGAAKAGSTSEAVANALGQLKAIGEREAIGVEGAKEVADITGKLLELM